MSVRKAAALAVAQLGVAAFFVAGTTRSSLGDSAAWFVLAAAIVGAFVRAIDIESWALLIPGGAVARVHQAFGARAAKAAAAAGLVERLLLAALACVVIGQYASTVALTAIAGWRLTGLRETGRLRDDRCGVAGRAPVAPRPDRVGPDVRPDRARRVDCRRHPDARDGLGPRQPVARTGAVGRSRVAASASRASPAGAHSTPCWSTSSASRWRSPPSAAVTPSRARRTNCGRPAFRRCSGRACSSPCSRSSPPCRGAFLFVLLVPAADQAALDERAARGAGAASCRTVRGRETSSRSRSSGPRRCCWCPRRTSRLSDAEQLLQRLSVEGALSERLAFLHTRFGTPSRAIDVAAAATILVMFVSGGRVGWLAHAYAMAIVATLALKIAALVRLRRLRPAARPFQAPFNLHLGAREIPFGLLAPRCSSALER